VGSHEIVWMGLVFGKVIPEFSRLGTNVAVVEEGRVRRTRINYSATVANFGKRSTYCATNNSILDNGL